MILMTLSMSDRRSVVRKGFPADARSAPCRIGGATQQHVAAMVKPFAKASERPTTFGIRPSTRTFMLSEMRLSSSVSWNSDSITSVWIDRARLRFDDNADVFGRLIPHIGEQRKLLLVKSSAIFSISRDFCTSHGISVTTMTQLPRPASSLVHARARGRSRARSCRLPRSIGCIDDDAACREIGPCNQFQQAFRTSRYGADQIERRVAKLRRIVGRNRCGHADGNALCAVGEQVREGRGKHDRLCRSGRHSWDGNRRRLHRYRRAIAAPTSVMRASV